jgi:glycosyltransferase involved in cell wall biosynthesis
MMDPDVSIILITYNDAKRLPIALHSLCDQTLQNLQIIVVDDASTDNTAEVVEGFQRRDDRIEYLKLESNSGGCSAPRNAGLAAARGTWVMFCDSDDRMERHAAKNLLLAAEDADADLGCGVAERVVGKRQKRWRDDAHEPGILTDIEQRPRLLYDTISVNKIYRREWLGANHLQFIEGLLYEDQIFTMQCYLRARRIAVIPQTVYYWTVDHLAEDRSITQQRDQLRNVRSRITVNELIDAELADRPSLKRHKDVKYLSHDVYLYCTSMLSLSDEQAAPIAHALAQYTEQLDLSLCHELRPGLRIAIYHLLIGDLAGVRSAMRNVKWSAVVDVPIARRGDRELWHCEHLDSGPKVGGLDPEWWLDVTELHPTRALFSQRRYCHRVVESATRGNQISVSGVTPDIADDFTPQLTATLEWQTRTGVVVAQSPVAWNSLSAHATWHWRGRWPKLPAGQGLLMLRIRLNGKENVMPIRAVNVSQPFVSADFGAVGWSSDRTSSRFVRAVAKVLGRILPRSSDVLIGGDGPVELDGAAAVATLLAERHSVRWIQHLGAPPAPAHIRAIRAGSFTHLLLATKRATVINDGGPTPFANWCRGLRVTAADLPPVLGLARRPATRRDLLKRISHWAWVCLPNSRAAQQWCADVQFDGQCIPIHPVWEAAKITERTSPDRTVLVLFAGEPDPHWVDIGAAIDARAQVIVRRADRRAANVPAHLRCWVRDGRQVPLADLLVNCDVVISDGAPAMYVAAALGKPMITWPPETILPSLAADIAIGFRAESPQQAAELAIATPHADRTDLTEWGLLGVGPRGVDVQKALAQVIR